MWNKQKYVVGECEWRTVVAWKLVHPVEKPIPDQDVKKKATVSVRRGQIVLDRKRPLDDRKTRLQTAEKSKQKVVQISHLKAETEQSRRSRSTFMNDCLRVSKVSTEAMKSLKGMSRHEMPYGTSEVYGCVSNSRPRKLMTRR
jgi:hypothetical protein